MSATGVNAANNTDIGANMMLLAPSDLYTQKERRHYPTLSNHSDVKFGPPAMQYRQISINSTSARGEKRHYCIDPLRSHLDDYF